MYIKAFLVVIICASSIARPSEEHDHDDENHHDEHYHDDHHHDEVIKICIEESGFPRENVEKIIFDKTGHFCHENGGSEWMSCYFKRLGFMDDTYALHEKHLQKDFVHDEESLKLFQECMAEAREEEDKYRACSLYHCVLEKGIVESLEHDYEDESHENSGGDEK